jgi:type II secretory pathway pseudopilin PulG
MNYPRLRVGHTLIEALIVIAILVILASLIYSNIGPVQEKGRRIACLSNLSQLNHAIALYRSDYDGEEASSTPAQCGFPPGAWELLPYTGREEGIFHCPSVLRSRISQLADPKTGRWTLYGMNLWNDDDPYYRRAPRWSEVMRERGTAFPILFCAEHNQNEQGKPLSRMFVQVARLNGSVKGEYVALEPSWNW